MSKEFFRVAFRRCFFTAYYTLSVANWHQCIFPRPFYYIWLCRRTSKWWCGLWRPGQVGAIERANGPFSKTTLGRDAHSSCRPVEVYGESWSLWIDGTTVSNKTRTRLVDHIDGCGATGALANRLVSPSPATKEAYRPSRSGISARWIILLPQEGDIGNILTRLFIFWFLKRWSGSKFLYLQNANHALRYCVPFQREVHFRCLSISLENGY